MLRLSTLILMTIVIVSACGVSTNESRLQDDSQASPVDIFPTPEAAEPNGEVAKKFTGTEATDQINKFLGAGAGPGSMYIVWFDQIKSMKKIAEAGNKSEFQVYQMEKKPNEGYETYVIRFIIDIGCAVETYEMDGTLQDWGFRGSPLKLIDSQTYCTTLPEYPTHYERTLP